MNQCDTNKDGKISFQEFVTRLRVAADRSYDYKKPVDVNGISVKDFCAALVNTGVLVGNAIPNAVEGTLVSVATSRASVNAESRRHSLMWTSLNN